MILHQSKKILGSVNLLGEKIGFEINRPDVIRLTVGDRKVYTNNLRGYYLMHTELYRILGRDYCQEPLRFTEGADDYTYVVENVFPVTKLTDCVRLAYLHIAEVLTKNKILVFNLYRGLRIRKTEEQPVLSYAFGGHTYTIPNPGYTVVLADFDDIETPSMVNYDLFRILSVPDSEPKIDPVDVEKYRN